MRHFCFKEARLRVRSVLRVSFGTQEISCSTLYQERSQYIPKGGTEEKGKREIQRYKWAMP